MRTNLGKRPSAITGRLNHAAAAFTRSAGFAVSIFLLLLLIFPSTGTAQTGSAVTGVVTDPTGALLPGVEVKLTDTKTSRTLTTTTNEQGVYLFNNVPQGTGYTLEFTGSGFRRHIINEVQLGIGKTETYNAQLAAGEVTASVEVTSTAGEATLNTTDASIGNVISERQIRELPIQLRDNPAALIGLQPGVIGNNVGTGNINRVGSVTGSRADQGNITVDGIDSNDVATGQAFVTVGNLPVDSVQEFRAVTTNPNSSEGRSSGGQIQMGTKSGSNEFHGSLREFYRGENFAANTFFNNRNGVERPALQRHQFGGSFSGPLPFPNIGDYNGPLFTSGKDRLFFFFDYEGRRDDSEISVARVVPLQNFREGRIAYYNNNAGCAAIPLDQISHSQNSQCISFLSLAQAAALDPRGVGLNQSLLNVINSRYPQANDPTNQGLNTGIFRFNAPVVLSNNTYTTRIDGNITDTQRAFGRVTITRNDQTNAEALFPGDPDSEQLIDSSYQIAGGHTWVVTPSFTNQFIIGLSRQMWEFPVPPSPAAPNIFSFGGLIQDPFASIAFQDRDVIVPTFRNDSTWTFGSHSMMFGGQFKPIRQKSTLISDWNFVSVGLGGDTLSLDNDPDAIPLRPSNIRDDVNAAAAFDNAYVFGLGRLATLTTNFVYDTRSNPQGLGTGRARSYAYNEYELYAQDNWKVRSDLTLNLGVRWHFYPAPYERSGFQAASNISFDELMATRVANSAAGIAGPDAAPLLTYDLVGKANDGPPLYKADWNNFAPRFGFAYNPSFNGGFLGSLFGDRKTVIRGGISKVFDRVGGALTFIQDQNSYVFDNQATQSFGALDPRQALLNDPRFTGLATLPVQNTPPVSTIPFTPDPHGLANFTFNYAISNDFEIPYSYQWSFGIQREIPGNMIIDVSYVGRRGKKLFAQSDASQVINFRDATSGQMMLDAFNALQLQLEANVPAGQTTPQPWIENQINAAIRENFGQQFSCANFGVPNCTRLVRTFFRSLAQQGGTADLVGSLYANGLLRDNVGLHPQFAVNAFITNQGFSQYDALLVSLRKRFSSGFQFDANYTWSHAIDNQSSVANAVQEGLIYNALNTTAGRGNADFDIRHLFNANAIWELPFGRGRAYGSDVSPWVNAFIGGWSVAGIFTARTGLPFTMFSNVWPVTVFTADDQGVPAVLREGQNTNFAVDIRDVGGDIQYFADPAAVQAAFRFPRHGEVGNRNVFRNEGYWNIDMVVSKRWGMPWGEGHELTFRAEAYNLLNKNFFGPPNLTFGSANFGTITTVQSAPRVLQFALRYDF